MHAMQGIMAKLRTEEPFVIAGYGVAKVIDYESDGTGLPKADVLEYRLDNGAKLMVRPSGTEPQDQGLSVRRGGQRGGRRRHQRPDVRPGRPLDAGLRTPCPHPCRRARRAAASQGGFYAGTTETAGV